MEKHYSTGILYFNRFKGGISMTLAELSAGYQESARLLRQRMKELRKALRQTNDPEEQWHLQRRIADLTPILTQMNELAELTAHYYDPGFWRNEKYTL
jgi:hypothetical protein